MGKLTFKWNLFSGFQEEDRILEEGGEQSQLWCSANKTAHQRQGKF